MSNVIEVDIARIKIDDRVRKSITGLDELSKSMERVGLLNPVTLDNHFNLVAGERRIRAAMKLGWKTIQARCIDGLDDAVMALIAERDENTCREPLAKTEMVALAKRLRELEKPKAAERQTSTRAKPGEKVGSAQGGEESSPPTNPRENGKTREKVAAAVGTSFDTLRKAEEVTEAAESDPETFGDLPDKMDAESVNAAHKEMKERKAEKKAEVDPLKAAADAYCTRLNQLTKQLDGISALVSEMRSEKLGCHIHWETVTQSLVAARKNLHLGRPNRPCPYCKATGKKRMDSCNPCKGTGHVDRITYRSGCEAVGIPEEKGND